MSVPTRFKVHTRVEPPSADVPGYDFKPDPSAVTTVKGLAYALETTRLWAGAPAIRTISGRCEHGQPSRAMFARMLKGDALPALDMVLVFVTALGLHDDLPVWADAWRRVALTAGSEGQ